jgi:ribonuclease HI
MPRKETLRFAYHPWTLSIEGLFHRGDKRRCGLAEPVLGADLLAGLSFAVRVMDVSFEGVSGRAEYLCYTDGSCKAGDGAPGGWGFCIKPPVGPPLESYGKARGTLAKVMEYRAVAEALAALPERATAIVFSDNQSLVLSLTKNLEAWRLTDFARVDPLVVESVRRIDACIVEKQLVVRWQWVRAHNGNAGNERADVLAGQGAREARAELTAGKPRRRG